MKPWWIRLAAYGRSELRGLTLLALLIFIGIAFSVMTPWPMKLIIDCVLMGQPVPERLAWINALPGSETPAGLLRSLVGFTILLFLGARAIGVAQSYVEAGVGTRMVYRLGSHLFDHMQRLSLRVHSQQRAGDLVDRLTTDSACVRDLVLGVFAPAVTSAVSLLTMFVVMWNLDRFLTLLALLAAVPLPIFMKVLSPKMKGHAYEKSRLRGQLMAHIEQTLSALPVVQAFGREPHADQTFRNLSAGVIRANLVARWHQLRFKIAVSAPTAIGAAALMVIGGLRVVQGSVSVGTLLVFLAYLDSLYRPIASLAYLSSTFATGAASARRVLEILNTAPDVNDAPGALPFPGHPSRARGFVRMESVTFGYETNRAVLKDITVEASPGEFVALVGPTGAGKSTLVSLIPRLFDPWEGRVLIDEMDVRGVKLASLRAQVSFVLQEPFLLPLTVAENIAYGRPEASREEVIAAAVAANADEFIRKLPKGYDTEIGERGATMSGGEKQRIAIARALLKDAPILVLDEPTSALDSETEASVLEALERLITGRTTFVIAHRLSTIRRAHKILVIDGGRIVETGTHAELLKAKAFYNKLHGLQHEPHEATNVRSSAGHTT